MRSRASGTETRLARFDPLTHQSKRSRRKKPDSVGKGIITVKSKLYKKSTPMSPSEPRFLISLRPRYAEADPRVDNSGGSIIGVWSGGVCERSGHDYEREG